MPRGHKTPPLYPNLDARVLERGGVYQMHKRIGLHPNTYYYAQRGEHVPTKDVIDMLLDYTGLTYEEAFAKEKRRPGATNTGTAKRNRF